MIARPRSAAVLALLLGACDRSAPAEEVLLEASESVSFGDIAGLGPHRLEASITRAKIISGQREVTGREQLKLVWRDWDNFSMERQRNGRAVSHVEVEEGVTLVEKADGSMRLADDPEPYRVELRMAWDVWGHNLSVFSDDMELEYLGDGLLDGRVARQYGVALKPDASSSAHSRTHPRSLEGSLWLDEATAVRLMAEVTGSWSGRRNAEIVDEISLILVRTDFGLPDPAAPGRLR